MFYAMKINVNKHASMTLVGGFFIMYFLGYVSKKSYLLKLLQIC
jgi:hypothetical protein